MFDTILFDLDNTLLDFNRGEAAALAFTLKNLGMNPTEEIIARYNVVNLSMWKLLEKGAITREELKSRRFRILFDEFGLRGDPVTTAGIYEDRLGQEAYFMEGAGEVLDRLHGRYRMYVVSNGTGVVQKNRMAKLGIDRYFEDSFISELIGANKPSVEYFSYCRSHISDFDPARTLLVGDSLTSDIQGGINAGISTLWLQLPGEKADAKICPDYIIYDIRELPAFLEDFAREVPGTTV